MANTSAREDLLREAAWFLREIHSVDGVRRVAVLGSLVTSKPEPKDCDFLLTVPEDLDLEPVARLGRKLQGHTQSLGLGSDVFLAAPDHTYLGRTCPWRKCGPQHRVRCDALHCGQREYLHDDLEAVELEEELIADPPVVLWPEVWARVEVPSDFERTVLQAARELTDASG